jgi:glycosyltransferase involved in cell wall biosynthesis
MKLLVLAQTPPPAHGQSIMVQTLVEGLAQVANATPGAIPNPTANTTANAGAPRLEVHHINLALSRDAADIGRVRPAKILALWLACLRALWRRARLGGRVTLYYVPAPARRAALCRDWIAMLLLRPFFTNLVLHWHASGLGEWIETKATAPERLLTRLLLGRAALSIVLAPELAGDAQCLRPKKIAVVPNGLSAPVPVIQSKFHPPPIRLLYLGSCTREKGVFDILDALSFLNGESRAEYYHLTIAGPFPDPAEERAFCARLDASPALARNITCAGPADESRKHALYTDADIFVFPTRYAHEAQPLVLIEALAHDLRIVATRWRAIPGMLPDAKTHPHIQLVSPSASPQQLAAAIRAARAAGPANGALRAHYEAHFTRDAHLAALARALREASLKT